MIKQMIALMLLPVAHSPFHRLIPMWFIRLLNSKEERQQYREYKRAR